MNDARDDHDDPTRGHESEPLVEPAEPVVDAELDPETDDFVRRLLADTRAETPTPDHVVARLDQTLAGLIAERAASSPTEHVEHLGPVERVEPAVVADLAAVRSRRRRRLLVGLGAAAALVVAAGVALPTLLGPDAADRGSVASTDQRVSDLEQQGPLTLRAASAEEAVAAYVAGLDEPVETPAVVPLRGQRADAEDSSEPEGSMARTREPFSNNAAAPLTCEEPGDGEVHPATYDGRPAVLVLTGLEDDSVLARVVTCGSEGDGQDDGDVEMNRTSREVVQFVVPQP
ncbi:hypothetical protein [Nocardioides gilvus]|uniref:hypothetical protein n=1 Tax=Nocardioides gilvus TaxID=1735589 RepID=UPI000D742EF5|nr:hypothetical protein [Nocardioides gilvus]